MKTRKNTPRRSAKAATKMSRKAMQQSKGGKTTASPVQYYTVKLTDAIISGY